jgi:hypothetical protein
MVGIQSLMNEDLFDALNSEECYINTQVRRRMGWMKRIG